MSPAKKAAALPPADDTEKVAEATDEPRIGIDVALGETGELAAYEPGPADAEVLVVVQGDEEPDEPREVVEIDDLDDPEPADEPEEA